MAKWVTAQLEELLNQINEVPYTDDRDRHQLTILMNGFAQLNNQAMDKAAARTRAKLRSFDLDATVDSLNKSRQKEKREDSAADELTRLRPIR